MAEGWAPVGWGAVAPDLSSIPATYTRAKGEEEDHGSNLSAAVPEDVIKAFLQSHAQSVQDGEPSQLSSAASLNSADEAELVAAFLSQQKQQQQPQQQALQSTPSSRQHQQPPSAPDIATRLPPVSGNAKAAAGLAGHASQQQSKRQKKSFLRRLMRALMMTSASAGLLAAGAWAGTAAYKHYMAQLDDRDQLARRVSELKKQEEKLVLRCTAVEQDRAGLQEQVAQLTARAADSDAARAKLKAELKHMQNDRDEAVRLNLKLQGKLTALEDSHASLQADYKDTQLELELARAEVRQLTKEADQLTAVVEKLESRCADLQSTKDALLRESAAISEALQQYKQQAAKPGCLKQ